MKKIFIFLCFFLPELSYAETPYKVQQVNAGETCSFSGYCINADGLAFLIASIEGEKQKCLVEKQKEIEICNLQNKKLIEQCNAALNGVVGQNNGTCLECPKPSKVNKYKYFGIGAASGVVIGVTATILYFFLNN